ncbi:helix-turn-helix domain-containing protein [Anaerocolumna jejuensis]|uniref:helix-turn-helix domain-containing protein n=1 Tax=Anaerocolumna jejuensis TaxID=259063 RepID=UPI003F7BBFA6
MSEVARMRTAHEAAKWFKQQDPETSFTEYHINRLINTGVIPVFRSGRRKLINLDKLIEYLNGEAKEPEKDSTYGKIRRVGD